MALCNQATLTLSEIIPVVQHRSPSFRHRSDDATGGSLRHGRCAHPATRCDARRRVRRQSDPFQGPRSEAAPAAHRHLDQSTEGIGTDQNHTGLLIKLMTPGVAKSLTRSEISAVIEPGTDIKPRSGSAEYEEADRNHSVSFRRRHLHTRWQRGAAPLKTGQVVCPSNRSAI
jgi:hypothetical protein